MQDMQGIRSTLWWKWVSLQTVTLMTLVSWCQHKTQQRRVNWKVKNNIVYLYVTFMIHELTNCVRVDKSIVQQSDTCSYQRWWCNAKTPPIWYGGLQTLMSSKQGAKDSSLLQYATVLVGKWILMFQRITEPSHSWCSSPRRPWNVENYLHSSKESYSRWLESSFKRFLQNTGTVHKPSHGTV